MDAAVNAPPPDFDSSDFEVSDREDPSRKAKRGEKITKAILENQAINRLESKKALRTLTYSYGAPGTQYHQDVVASSWDAYCQTVSHDIATCPTGDLIFRYINTVVQNTKSAIPGKHAPSLVVIQAVWRRVVQLLQFRHEDILKHYTPHHVMRITVHLDQLVRQKKLIRGDWFKKMWIGFILVLKMATAWIKDALENGTNSWDITISKLTSVVLQSAMSSRSGDITRSQLYEGLECLCWGHVTLTLSSPATPGDAPTVQDLKGTFDLEFTKGKKATRNATHTLFCNPLETPSQSIACPIKLLLVLALRLGNVHGRTIEDCLTHTIRRFDRTIQWKEPDAPVFCKMKGLSAFLQLNEPAGQPQVRHTLQEMALLTGVLDRVDTRGLRRGALRDQAYVDKMMTGVATRCTALVAGHSSAAFALGVTQDYVGAIEEPVYNLRSEHPREDRLTLAIAPQGGPSIAWRQERATRLEIDTYMKAHDMDVGDNKQRRKAGRHMKLQKIADWQAEARNAPAPMPVSQTEARESGASIPAPPNSTVPVERPSLDTMKQTGQTGSGTLRQRTTGEVNSSQGRISSKRRAVDDNAAGSKRCLLEQPPSTATVAPEWLDPQLFELQVEEAGLDSLASKVFAHEGDSSDDTSNLDGVQTGALEIDAVDEAMIDEQVTGTPVFPETLSTLSARTQGPQFLEAATIGGNSFVHFFSTINVFQNQTAFDRNDMVEAAKYVPCGNSRDRPTPFPYSCSKGCGYSKELRYKVVTHEVNCKGQSKDRLFKCQRSGCQKSFKTDMSLRDHVGDVHDFKPIACHKCPDQPTIVYETKRELKRHRDAVHCVVETQHCPLQEQCGLSNAYTRKTLLRQHLRRKHLLTNEQIKEYVPDGRKGHSNNKGKKRKPKGWHLAAGGVEENEALDECGGDMSSDSDKEDEE